MGVVVELNPATIARLHLEPGDIVIVRYPGRLSPSEARRLHEQVADALPGYKAIIVSDNISIEVVEKRAQ